MEFNNGEWSLLVTKDELFKSEDKEEVKETDKKASIPNETFTEWQQVKTMLEEIGIGDSAKSTRTRKSQMIAAFQRIFTNLEKQEGFMQVALEDLGISLTDSEGNTKSTVDIIRELMNGFSEMRKKLSYMESRRERLVQKMGNEEFKSTVEKIEEILKKNNLDKSPAAREDLFEFINAYLGRDWLGGS